MLVSSSSSHNGISNEQNRQKDCESARHSPCPSPYPDICWVVFCLLLKQKYIDNIYWGKKNHKFILQSRRLHASKPSQLPWKWGKYFIFHACCTLPWLDTQYKCTWKCHHHCFQARLLIAKVCWIESKEITCRGERRGGRKLAVTKTRIRKWKKKVIFSPFWIIPIKLPLFITIHCTNPKADPFHQRKKILMVDWFQLQLLPLQRWCGCL